MLIPIMAVLGVVVAVFIIVAMAPVVTQTNIDARNRVIASAAEYPTPVSMTASNSTVGHAPSSANDNNVATYWEGNIVS